MEKLYAIKDHNEIKKFFNINKIKEFGNIKNYSSHYIFELLINNRCDFNCSYCYMHKDLTWGETSISKKFNIIMKLIDKINKVYPTEICLSGGEALLHSKISEFFDVLKKLNWKKIHINTNLSRSFKKLKKIIEKNDFDLYLHSSYHPSQQDFNEILEKILFLEKHKIYYELNFMFDINFNTIDKLIKEFLLFKEKIQNGKLYCKFIYNNNEFTKFNFKEKDRKILSENADKEYYAIIGNNKFLLNDVDLFDYFPLNFYKYNCNYTFFTINVINFKIKEMCSNFNLDNFLSDYKFFLNYPKKIQKFTCPHKKCLWPSALDMKKVKK